MSLSVYVDFWVESGIFGFMDIDEQKLDEILELSRENNKFLRSMRRSQRWSSFFTFLYWFIILGSIFGIYYYFQPTIQRYVQAMQTSAEILQKFEGAAGGVPSDVNALKNWLGR